MGTPDFAVPTLERLADSRHTVLAAVTNPDRPKGRGRKLAAPPVKESALALDIPVIQPSSADDAQLQAELTALAPDLFVVVAFSILPKALTHHSSDHFEAYQLPTPCFEEVKVAQTHCENGAHLGLNSFEKNKR